MGVAPGMHDEEHGPDAPEPTGVPDGPEPAGIVVRIAAATIDFILAVLLFIIVASALGMLEIDPDDPWAGADRLDLNLLSPAILILYHGILEVATGRTLGKWAFGLLVVGADGSALGAGAGALRNLLRPIDYIFFWIPGLLAIVLSPRNQRIGDMAAHTLVVRAGSATGAGSWGPRDRGSGHPEPPA